MLNILVSGEAFALLVAFSSDLPFSFRIYRDRTSVTIHGFMVSKYNFSSQMFHKIHIFMITCLYSRMFTKQAKFT